MKNEELGSRSRIRCASCHRNRNCNYKSFIIKTLRSRGSGKSPGTQRKQQHQDSNEETAYPGRAGCKKEKQEHGKKNCKKHYCQHRPSVGTHPRAHRAQPSAKKKLRDHIYSVLSKALGIFQIVACILVGRVKFQSPFIPQYAVRKVPVFKAGTSEIVAQLR